ncbi:MAG: ubiquinol oxidase subunit II [Burkholderia sp.]|nr:ubiquinol oxidase subunit II [Burkholderia sp.]
MNKPKKTRKIWRWLAIGGLAVLFGCSDDLHILSPKGAVGVAEKELIVKAILAMLLIVIPVILITLFFVWRYRASKRSSDYSPDWSHSTIIEITIWIVPTLIVIYLSSLAWRTSHDLDPYKKISSPIEPIDVEVVALDWKWLFIYPKFGIASLNELAIPVATPVNFRITSDSVMNSFFIAELGSQVYAMAGMQTRLHLIADKVGDYVGISSNYSGRGFSDMRFHTLAKPRQEFDEWVKKVKSSSDHLDMLIYQNISQPSEKVPVRYFLLTDSQLFKKIITKYNNSHAHNIKMTSCKIKGYVCSED